MIINLCPYDISFYPEDAFQNLQKNNSLAWVADGVDESKLLRKIESSGVGRIFVKLDPIEREDFDGVPAVVMNYAPPKGFPPEMNEGDVYIVSHQTLSAAKASNSPLARFMATAYGVVKLRGSAGKVLGCMGLAF